MSGSSPAIPTNSPIIQNSDNSTKVKKYAAAIMCAVAVIAALGTILALVAQQSGKIELFVQAKWLYVSIGIEILVAAAAAWIFKRNTTIDSQKEKAPPHNPNTEPPKRNPDPEPPKIDPQGKEPSKKDKKIIEQQNYEKEVKERFGDKYEREIEILGFGINSGFYRVAKVQFPDTVESNPEFVTVLALHNKDISFQYFSDAKEEELKGTLKLYQDMDYFDIAEVEKKFDERIKTTHPDPLEDKQYVAANMSFNDTPIYGIRYQYNNIDDETKVITQCYLDQKTRDDFVSDRIQSGYLNAATNYTPDKAQKLTLAEDWDDFNALVPKKNALYTCDLRAADAEGKPVFGLKYFDESLITLYFKSAEKRRVFIEKHLSTYLNRTELDKQIALVRQNEKVADHCQKEKDFWTCQIEQESQNIYVIMISDGKGDFEYDCSTEREEYDEKIKNRYTNEQGYRNAKLDREADAGVDIEEVKRTLHETQFKKATDLDNVPEGEYFRQITGTKVRYYCLKMGTTPPQVRFFRERDQCDLIITKYNLYNRENLQTYANNMINWEKLDLWLPKGQQYYVLKEIIQDDIKFNVVYYLKDNKTSFECFRADSADWQRFIDENKLTRAPIPKYVNAANKLLHEAYVAGLLSKGQKAQIKEIKKDFTNKNKSCYTFLDYTTQSQSKVFVWIRSSQSIGKTGDFEICYFETNKDRQSYYDKLTAGNLKIWQQFATKEGFQPVL